MNAFLAPLLEAGITKLLLYLASIGGAAAIVPFILEALKGRVPLLGRYHDTLTKTTAVIVAVATSLGIGYSYDLGTGKLVLEGLTPINLAWFLLGVAGQFGLQEWIFQRLIKAPRNGPPL